jgi:hypothetical protein
MMARPEMTRSSATHAPSINATDNVFFVLIVSTLSPERQS